MSDILLQFPRSANFPLNISASVTLSPAGGDSVRNVFSLPLIPNQTGLNPRQLQNPQSVPAVFGPQEAVQLVVTQRAREALHDQVETARRDFLHQQGEPLATDPST